MNPQHLEVVKDGQKNPDGLHLRIVYDVDSAHGYVYNGEDLLFGTGFEFVRTHESWDAVREAVIRAARDKLDLLERYGPAPANETIHAADIT
jgi:hypothetical protein